MMSAPSHLPQKPSSPTTPPEVVVVGAGFAGMEVAKGLGGAPVRVTVIDRHNYNLFQPLLYQVATAALSPADVAVPIRSLLRYDNIHVILDEVVGTSRDARLVHTAAGREIRYDYLILATGSVYDYFGHDHWAAVAPAPKTIDVWRSADACCWRLKEPMLRRTRRSVMPS